MLPAVRLPASNANVGVIGNIGENLDVLNCRWLRLTARYLIDELRLLQCYRADAQVFSVSFPLSIIQLPKRLHLWAIPTMYRSRRLAPVGALCCLLNRSRTEPSGVKTPACRSTATSNDGSIVARFLYSTETHVREVEKTLIVHQQRGAELLSA